MDFIAKIRISVPDHDADVMQQFPDAVMQRFRGTAIKITSISVTKTTIEDKT
jgi:hypothetical protein